MVQEEVDSRRHPYLGSRNAAASWLLDLVTKL